MVAGRPTPARSTRPARALRHRYRKKEVEYKEREAELLKISDARDAMRREFEELRKRRLDEVRSRSRSHGTAERRVTTLPSTHSLTHPRMRARAFCLLLLQFMAGFNRITMKLKEMYQMITLGGDAELELVDTLDPFSEGASPRRSTGTQSGCRGSPQPSLLISILLLLQKERDTEK